MSRPIQLRPEERCECGEPLAGRCIACTVSAYQSERASASAAAGGSHGVSQVFPGEDCHLGALLDEARRAGF